METFQNFWRRWRRKVKAIAPFVRRRQFRIIELKYAALIQSTLGTATPAGSAKLLIRKAIKHGMSSEVCLFITHAERANLKGHVVNHLNQLLNAGIAVVLIVNTDQVAGNFEIDPGLETRLSGILIRDNAGFDFGAWAHAYSVSDRKNWARMYLINDSIVGPLDDDSFDRVLASVRRSNADFVGLTESIAPIRHLQSYFLVFNQTALRSLIFQRFMHGILNFPDKGQVVDVYEINLTHYLIDGGLRAEALFPPLSDDYHNADDTASRWDQLLKVGFPYLKTRVIQDLPQHLLVKAARAKGHVDSQI